MKCELCQIDMNYITDIVVDTYERYGELKVNTKRMYQCVRCKNIEIY